MDADPRALVDRTPTDTIELSEHVRQHAPPVVAAAAIRVSLRAGGTRLLFGNGGSAAHARHVAAGLVGRVQHQRAAMAAIVRRAAAIHVNVPAPNPERVQEVHRRLMQVICDLVESACVDR